MGTDATFESFNKKQIQSAPIDLKRKERVLKHTRRILDATPYKPLHFVDTQFTNTPKGTGTGYHNRHCYKTETHAKYSRPDLYSTKTTSKGYYYNAFYEFARK